MNSRASVRLPAPQVRFGEDFLPRLGKLRHAHLARRERREGAGQARLLGVGSDFQGFRPYRPGEDLRMFDWGLFARTKKPFVRVARRESSESWAVIVDSSGSMGVGARGGGPRGKLQLAAEVATGICALGLVEGATIELVLSSAPKERLLVRRAHGVKEWMQRLEKSAAAGDAGLLRVLKEPGRVRNAGAVFLIGDFLDVEPQEVLHYQRRGRQLFCIQILAPHELLAPSADASGAGLEWVDAEHGETLSVSLDKRTRESYDALLSSRLENMRSVCARHRIGHSVWHSETPFEGVMNELF